jgi:hypothetical protein
MTNLRMDTEQAKNFIRAWQAARHVKEVTQQFNMSYGQAVMFAARLRYKGIELKKFKANADYDIDELKEFFDSLDGEA